MALDLYMLGLIVADMAASVAFYRRLGVAVPDDWEGKTHVQVKMGTGLTFFLDSRPDRWDPRYREQPAAARSAGDGYGAVLEFYLKTQDAVEARYADLTAQGYRGRRAPYATSFGMCFALIDDPDGNTLLLSGDLAAPPAA